MCGVSGILGYKGRLFDNSETIVKMVSSQHHRGPDDTGIVAYSIEDKKYTELPNDTPTHLKNSCNGFLGFNRLSIRDLSLNGHQPMIADNKQVAITFNGEIYNSDDIKDELLKKGYKFRSSTDTEVILLAYLEYGFDAMVRKLNGMFAIVIMDLNKNVCFLARDRVGIKPLYYYLDDKALHYASEYKSFLYNDDFVPELSYDALYEKLLYRGGTYSSLLKNVDEVKPGTYLVFNFSSDIKIVRYYSIDDYNQPVKASGSDEKYKAILENALSNSIKRQMISDVKVGCQLSGGVDSSLVTWHAKKLCPNELNDTISIVQANEDYSEEKFMDFVIDKLDITPHKIQLNQEIVYDTIEKIIWHAETFLTQPSVLGLYQLTNNARKHVTVLLSGEGADELMGGYDCWYDDMYRIWNRYPLNRNIDQFADLVANMEIDTDIDILKRAVPSINVSEQKNRRKKMFLDMHGDGITRMRKYHFNTYLPELLLRQDKMSMANSIENRVPILDNEMIDCVYSLPAECFVKGEKWHISKRSLLYGKVERVCENVQCKYLFKEICSDHFGRNFAYRKKLGFPMPIIDFMCNDLFIKNYNDILLPSIKKRGIINVEEMEKIYSKGSNMTFNESETLWRLLTFEMWCQLFLDKKVLK